MKLTVKPEYRSWVATAEALLLPLVERLYPAMGCFDIGGQASNHDSDADRLEAFARPFLLAAQYLVASHHSGKINDDELCTNLRKTIITGVTPGVPGYWGEISNYHQHTVESGLIIIALELTRPLIWETFSSNEKELFIGWLSANRGLGYHQNNHMFFGIFPLSFLQRERHGREYDNAICLRLLEKLERMYIGGGWFEDGMNETVDYYNAYAFHYYMPMWIKIYGGNNPELESRWKGYLHQFLNHWQYFFAADGSIPPFGRSITYRFAVTAPFGLGAELDCLPFPGGTARNICTENLNYFLQGDCLDENGLLTIGWLGEMSGISEKYSCGASPYWAAKAFFPLTLPEEHPFWQSELKPYPSRREDYFRYFPEAELAVRSTGGQVELINYGTNIFTGNTYFGPYKWGKNSYRSDAGFEVPDEGQVFSRDSALTIEAENGTVFGRFKTHTIDHGKNFSAFAYDLGDRFTRLNTYVETFIWFNEDWQLQLHRYISHQPAKGMLGGFSLSGETTPEISIDRKRCLIMSNHMGSAIYPLGATVPYRLISKSATTKHLKGGRSAYPAIELSLKNGEGFIAALIGCGREVQKKQWKLYHAIKGEWKLKRGNGECWIIHNRLLPQLQLE